MINFPNNPKVGDAFTLAGTNYRCVQVAPIVWNAAPSSTGIPDAPVDTFTYGRRAAAWKALDKTDVGLALVDNTTDATKPVSGPQQTALNGKEPTLAVSTAANYYRGDKTWQALTKAAVGLGSVDNTADAAKTVQSALYMRSAANPVGALIPFSWSDDSTSPTYYWGGTNANGQVYHYTRCRVGIANSADYASGAGNVNGISGWNYQNRAKNPVYLWATDGSGQDQYLTQPGNITSGRTASIEGASGGTIQTDMAVQTNLWTNTGFIRAGTNLYAVGGVYANNGHGIAMIPNGTYPYIRFSDDGWRLEWDGTNGTIRYYNQANQAVWWCGGAGDFNVKFKGHQPGAGLWGDNSDARIKDNIEDYTQGLTAILALRPRRFNFKAETGRDPKQKYVGLIAQEAREPMPEMVFQALPLARTMGEITLEDMLAMDATPMLYALVNAVKELNAKIEALSK